MRKNILDFFLSSLLIMASFTGCDNKKDPEPVFAAPAISITNPTDLTALKSVVGEPLSFSLSVTAEAGLSSVSVKIDGISSEVKKYATTQTTDVVEYNFVAAEKGDYKIIFVTEDAKGKTTSTDEITVTVSGYLGYLLVDFSGESTSNSEKVISQWDTRTLFTFDITSSLESTATAEIPNNQGLMSFVAENPDDEDDQKVFKLIRTPKEGFANWGGYVNVVLGFDNAVPEAEINALPSWDAANDKLVDGDKVVAIDVYYDATVDPDFSWETFKGLAKNPWEEGDPALGYPLLLTLGDYANLSASPDGSGYYIAYHAYLTEPNTWQTVIFDKAALSRIPNFYAEGDATKNPAAPDEVTAVVIAPARAYVNSNGVDINPVYFKNLRIIDKE